MGSKAVRRLLQLPPPASWEASEPGKAKALALTPATEPKDLVGRTLLLDEQEG